jgi:hypothetical protein
VSAAPRPPTTAAAPDGTGLAGEPAAAPPDLEAVATRVESDLLAPLAREMPRLFVGLASLSLVTAAHVARIGTGLARIAALILLASPIVAATAALVIRRRRRGDPRAVVRAAGEAFDRHETSRALAHVALAERIEASPGHEGVSPGLARLHAARALARLPLERLAPLGARRATIARSSALAVAFAALVVLAVAHERFVEGVDVALARKGVAPLSLPWLDDVVVTIHPPAYLHLEDRKFHLGEGGLGERTIEAHRGSSIVVRGRPRRTGRELVLFGSAEGGGGAVREVPFLDDGKGRVVAHWSVESSGSLRVRARFGPVAIDEPQGFGIRAIADAVPVVELEGAPGSIEIAKAEGAIPLRYDASDDHGLREVHLVLRVGAREERRVLAKLDGEPKHDRGGYVLRTTDPLIAKARTPVAVRIEARDNDPVTGPKWGRSADLTLVPPVVGAAEAKRYAAVRAVRDRLVDDVAAAIDKESSPDPAIAKALDERFGETERAIEEVLIASHDGLRISSRTALLVRGRIRKVHDALVAARKSPRAKYGAVVDELSKLALSVDSALRALGSRDAKTIAKLLADVAEDGANAIRESSSDPSDGATSASDASARLAVDLEALDGGGGSLRSLGELGRDLGEIVENDLRRVARGRTAGPAHHAELALRDLAMRLRDPTPSFGGGTNPSAPGEPTDDDDVDGEGDESEGEAAAGDQQQKLEELAKEHGGATGEVEDLLRAAEDPKGLEGIEEEAKRRAKALRDSVAKLPKIAGLRKTLEAAEAAAREKVEGMAEALEGLQIGDAREKGDSSLKSLEEARDKAWSQIGEDAKLDQVGREVQKQIDWIDDLLAKLRKAAAQKAQSKVKSVAPREKGLEQKATEMADEKETAAPLPGPIRDLLQEAAKKMKDASEKLERGEGDKGLEAQKEAQRLLERARDAARAEEPEGRGEHGGKQLDPDAKLDIPKAEDHKGPEAFRKRVLEGLGSGASSGRLKDAVKRYAEGLIK